MPVTGARDVSFMAKKPEYTKGPIDDIPDEYLVEVPDFLPPPEVLAKAQTNVKITIKLSFETIEFFKEVAEKHNTQYQPLIRKVLDEYVAAHRKPKAEK